MIVVRGRGVVRALLTIAGILAVVYVPLAFGQIVFFRDASRWNYPARWFLHHAHATAQAIAWNPYAGLGLPVRANPLYAPYYPLHWLYAVTPTAWIASMATWQVLAHLVAGSAGAALLARRFGASVIGIVIAGLAWGLSGWATSGWVAGLLLPAGAWVPWVALGWARLTDAARADGPLLRAIAWAAVPIAGALLYGEIFVATMGVAFAVAVALATHRPASSRGWWRLSGGAAAACAIAACIGAVVVLPARSLSAGNQRASALPRDVAEAASLHPLRSLEMIVPGAMGEPAGDYPGARVIGEPTLGGHPLFYDVYLGASVVALAIVALGRRRAAASGIAAIAGLALVIAVGKHTPLHQVLRTVLRPLAYMRYPEKYLVLVVTPIAVLAGLGATRLLEASDRVHRRIVAVLGVVALVAAFAPFAFPGTWSGYVLRGALRAAAALVALLVAAYLARRRPRVAAAVLTLAVAVDLGTQALPSLELDDRSIAAHVPPAARAILDDHRAHGGGAEPPRMYRPDTIEPSIARFNEDRGFALAERRGIATLIPNFVTTFGIGIVPGYDAALPSSLATFWKRSLKAGFAVLRLFAVDYVILPADPRAPLADVPGFRAIADPVPGARLFHVENRLPRVYLAGRGDVATDDDAFGRVFDPDVLSGGVALLAPDEGTTALAGRPEVAGSCSVEAFLDTRVVARCRAERAAIAVFVEQHAAGWRATVDGVTAPLLRANLLMRAVPVPAGEHRIELVYEVPGATPAAAATIVGLLALAALVVVGRRNTAR